jgi:hypothetical protein
MSPVPLLRHVFYAGIDRAASFKARLKASSSRGRSHLVGFVPHRAASARSTATVCGVNPAPPRRRDPELCGDRGQVDLEAFFHSYSHYARTPDFTRVVEQPGS